MTKLSYEPACLPPNPQLSLQEATVRPNAQKSPMNALLASLAYPQGNESDLLRTLYLVPHRGGSEFLGHLGQKTFWS